MESFPMLLWVVGSSRGWSTLVGGPMFRVSVSMYPFVVLSIVWDGEVGLVKVGRRRSAVYWWWTAFEGLLILYCNYGGPSLVTERNFLLSIGLFMVNRRLFWSCVYR